MAVPYQPQNLTAEQADGNILLTWSGSLGAVGYQIQRSTDNVNFSNLAMTGVVTQFVDMLPGVGVMYYYQVAATNLSGTSTYSSIAKMVAAPPSEMSLYELRLRAQQTADRVGSQFVVTSEWNAFLRLAMYELYDLLITSYEDLFASQFVFINTNGTIQNYPIPDGATNYLGGTFPNTPQSITPAPPQTFTPVISTSAFDPTLLEFVGGVLRQKDQRPATATFYAAWSSMLNANWSGPGNGSLVITSHNGAAIGGGRLDLTGTTNKFITFDPINNADSLETGTIEFQYTPNYTGTPGTPQVLLNLSTANNVENNLIDIEHFTDGKIYFQLQDHLNAVIVDINAAFNPTAGTTYTFLVQYDGTIGSNKLFINGAQIGSTDTHTFVRSAPIGFGISGKYYDQTLAGANANFSISNFSFYSTSLTPASPTLSPTIYPFAVATLPEFTYIGGGSVVSYNSFVVTDSGTPHYTLNGDYWDGSMWVVSDGTYAQSNDSATVNTHIASLAASNTLQVDTIYQAGSVQENISALTVTYIGQVIGPAILPSPAFYKLAGMDLGINTSNNAWVTLLKFDFIERNKYVYPNSTSTIYGVYNMRYRLMGNFVNIIPTPAGNQQIRMWYSPKLPALLKDSDTTTLGYSGWLRYPIVRAAKYALDKEEGSDTSKLDQEIAFLKIRIEQASQNRDAGVPDTISNTRVDPLYGGNGFASGGGGSAGW